MDPFLSVLAGIGLSAACGFRIFVPMLVMSIAVKAGHLEMVSAFQWVGSDTALIAFAVATCLEIAAYYIPWFDHLMDTIATPTAIVAGTIVTASMVGGMSPFLKWTLAVIAGGGAAGLVQGATVVTRAASGATTGGLGNPIVATLELVGSIFMSVLAVLVPVAAVVLFILGVIFLWRKVGTRLLRRASAPSRQI
ncbi:MAG: DUF4126 domain-containing protein [Verrucomicrobiota bacterium]